MITDLNINEITVVSGRNLVSTVKLASGAYSLYKGCKWVWYVANCIRGDLGNCAKAGFAATNT
jgi:hypothetical protein